LRRVEKAAVGGVFIYSFKETINFREGGLFFTLTLL
jgi:hypothetical protein